MALIRTGSIVTDIRGSVGTDTYARNASGLYVRNRTFPDQTESDERPKRQAAMTLLSQAWSGTLTEAQRLTWRTYAARHPMPNRLGELRYLDGLRHFIRCNAQHYRITEGITHLTAPPGPPTHAPLFTFWVHTIFNRVTIDLPPLNYDPPPTGLCLYAYAGIEVNQGVNYYMHPFRFGKYTTWDGSNWLDMPFRMDLWYDATDDHRVFARMVAVLANGETSTAGYAHADT